MLEAICLGGLKTKCVARSCFCVSETRFLSEYQLTALHKYAWEQCLSLFACSWNVEYSTGQAAPLLRSVVKHQTCVNHRRDSSTKCINVEVSLFLILHIQNINIGNWHLLWNYSLPAAQPHCCAGRWASWCRSFLFSSWHPWTVLTFHNQTPHHLHSPPTPTWLHPQRRKMKAALEVLCSWWPHSHTAGDLPYCRPGSQHASPQLLWWHKQMLSPEYLK